ncbi:MAG: rod shape-determining protein [bacterium]|nr:rod shape-determining protein [bacterium]MXX65225.1 rod shape-determining protein [Acidimicrobiia bacterium]MCY3580090.1 rod shape-determining protein [bacterium]MCY3652731.1 rod shape-determining protein [bacterium]MDE0643800.1 rod shape-determining protein [bacterium]
MPDRLFLVAGQDMAIDLGTANTLVYVRDQGVLLNEPSVVAINTNTNEALAVGMDAKRMIGRTPSYVEAIRPLRDGVIADFDITERMLRYFIKKVHRNRWAKPRIVICVPSGITGVERRAVEEAAYHAGARNAFTIDEPMAAAIGCDMPVQEPTGSMVVDIGGGTTEVAVIAMGGVVVSRSVRVGGDAMDERIIEWVKKEHNLLLGLRTAEQIKMAIGSAYPYHNEPSAEVRGRDLEAGLPKTILLSAAEVRAAIEEPVATIVDAIRYALDNTPPELAADLMNVGIMITGGGALLKVLNYRVAIETGLRVEIAERPLQSVVVGSGRCLEQFDLLHGVLESSGRF